jgi:phosphoglycerate dehydrogenase-like enzyme
MMPVAVVSAHARELAACLEGDLPPEVRLVCATTGDELSAQGLAAPIAFGAPDELAPLVARMPQLLWVQSTWAGITPFLQQPRRDYQLTGVKGLFGAAMSEYVLGWALALRRSILEHAAATSWTFRRDPGLVGCRLGIAGTGSIGREVAARCAPFFSEVVGLNSDGRAVPGFSRCFGVEERCVFAADLDILALVLPDTPETDRLFAQRELACVRSGAILINGGRANALDLPAAVAALDSKRLSALVLDVFEHEPLPDADPLWARSDVYVTSHTAAPTDMGAVARVFLTNLKRFLAGRPLEGLIDFERGY